MHRASHLDNHQRMHLPLSLVIALSLVTACGAIVVEVERGEGEGEGEGEDEAAGTLQDPIVVNRFPFTDARDTSEAVGDAFVRYSCAPGIDESGPAFVYRLELPGPGRVQASVVEDRVNHVDVDVHLLETLAADSCLVRGNLSAGVVVQAASTLFLVVDTYVDGGVPQVGPFALTVTFSPAASGNCATTPRELEMVWSSCGSITGCVARGGRVFLPTPVTGPVVKEAHLVTTR